MARFYKLSPKVMAEIEDLGIDPVEAITFGRKFHIDYLTAALILAA